MPVTEASRRARNAAWVITTGGCLLLASRGWLPMISLAPVHEHEALSSNGFGFSGSPIGLAAEYVSLDISYLRWMWWPAILYLFWAMAFVCDEYFVRTIDVISDRFQIPDDVAGATLMALGCNGPEMALNTISIFHPSNIGVGAVVGGEVFNVLVIIGTALLATPDMYMPLKLGRFNFFRDVIFYMLSVAMLYWVLKNGEVSRFNAAALLFCAVIYTLTVTFSVQISRFFSRESKVLLRSATVRLSRTRLSRLSFMSRRSACTVMDAMAEDSDSDEEFEADPETVEYWHTAQKCQNPEEGSVLGVRVDVRNRLMDRNHRVDLRYMYLRHDALVVSTLVDPTAGQGLERCNSGMVYDHDHHADDQHWHHGGLVNQPVFLNEQTLAKSGDDLEASQLSAAFSATPIAQLTRPLLNEAPKGKMSVSVGPQCPPPMDVSGFKQTPWEVIPLEDILYCERGIDGEKQFNLHVHQHDSHLGNLITLELSAKEGVVMTAWVHALQTKLLEQRRRTTEAPPAKTGIALMLQWVEWLQFPVRFFVEQTIPDMDDPKQQHLYPVSFTMSMVWLAVFAFCVVRACDGIHADFGISTDVLGFTVAAAGTSFPNVFSGMCVARQGKTSMAVANALGANVQNVFLALAVPWMIQSFFLVGGPFPMPVDNLLPAVLECAITLMPVVLVYTCCSFSMPKWSGGLFLLTYVIYVIFALGQQLTKCPIWPLPCGAVVP